MEGAPASERDEFRARVRAWFRENAPARGWLRGEGEAPGAEAAEPADRVRRARECQRLLFEAGLAGITWPPEYGGRGLSNREQIVFNEETSGYDLPLMPLFVGLGMCGPTLLAVGTESQKRRYVRPLLRGDEIWCQLFSEPNAGSDVAGVQTRAVRDGDGWVLTGQKVWTSVAHQSDFGLAVARTDPDAPKHRGITMFIVDMRSAGITVKPLRQMNGAAGFNEVFMEGVRVPAEHVLGGVNEGWRAALATLMNERVSIGAGRSSSDPHRVRSLIDRARAQGLERDPLVRQALADLYILDRIVALVSRRVTDAVMAGRVPGPEGSVAKLVSTALAKRAAELGVALAGMADVAWDPADPAGARWADVLLLSPALLIAGGTDEVLRNIIGERVLGLPKEPQVDRDVPFRETLRAP